jgi:hypothetical protein
VETLVTRDTNTREPEGAFVGVGSEESTEILQRGAQWCEAR